MKTTTPNTKVTRGQKVTTLSGRPMTVLSQNGTSVTTYEEPNDTFHITKLFV